MKEEVYNCRGLTLVCNKPSYTVKVERTGGIGIPENPISDLPDWVFSDRAIWLTCEEKPMFQRASRGDEIKHVFWDLTCQNSSKNRMN
jgi:hypothetical protein